MKNEERNSWSNKDTKTLTEEFINHIYEAYYKSYKDESERYERINNRIFMSITIIGFLVTILIGLKEILFDKTETNHLNIFLKIITFILPSVSSLLLLYWTQKGYKKKEEIREIARIESKYLVNIAKIRFSKIKDNQDELENLYNWLNEQVKQLQLSQANIYFSVHNMTEISNKNDHENDFQDKKN